MGDISESMFAEEVLTSSVAAIPAVKLDELPPGEAGDAIGVKKKCIGVCGLMAPNLVDANYFVKVSAHS